MGWGWGDAAGIGGGSSVSGTGTVSIAEGLFVLAGDSAENASYVADFASNHGHRYARVESLIPATGVTLDQSALTLEVGATARLTATREPADANEPVTWTSDNKAVATVDACGRVSAVSEGTATITATAKDGGFTAQCVVTVHEAFGTPDFILPAGLTTIEANAFEGNAMTVVDAHTCTSIGAEAFKDCAGLEKIRLPKKCAIDPSAFSGCGDIQVYAPAGSTTESWCKKNGVQYIIY